MIEPTFNEFLKAFNSKSYLDLFQTFKNFEQMGPKKSALFLRDIFYFGNIISNVPSNLKKEYIVPVDRVIVRTVNSIFNRSYIPNYERTFREINKLASNIFPDEPILLEDFWFWGRFYRCKCKENKINNDIPYCKFNEDLLTIDINITKEFRSRILDFIRNHKECPFKNICEDK